LKIEDDFSRTVREVDQIYGTSYQTAQTTPIYEQCSQHSVGATQKSEIGGSNSNPPATTIIDIQEKVQTF
jgi:hypothetical protein